jgi:hypothetical protein
MNILKSLTIFTLLTLSPGVFAESRSGSGIGGSTLSVSDLEVIFAKNCDAYKFANISFYQRVAFNVLLSVNGADKSTIATESGNVIRMMFSPTPNFAKLLVSGYAKYDKEITTDKAIKRFSDYKYEADQLAFAYSELKRIGIDDILSTSAGDKLMNQKTVVILKSFLSKDSIQGTEAHIRASSAFGIPDGLNPESERLLKSACD